MGGAVYVPDQATYQAELQSAGFSDIVFEELTNVWARWTQLRFEEFEKKREDLAKTQGEARVANMETFYGAVPKLFASGRLGGVRITGIKSDKTGTNGAAILKAGRSVLGRRKPTNEMTREEVAAVLKAEKTV